MRLISRYQDDSGNEILSLTESINAWRSKTKTVDVKMPSKRDVESVCPDCSGWGEVKTVEFGWILCHCYIQNKIRTIDEDVRPYRSKVDPSKSLDNFTIWEKNNTGIDSLITIKDYITKWLEWPEKWIFMHGLFGCGKTHLLYAMANHLGSPALYITAGDFESKCFRAIKGSNGNSVEGMFNAISDVPYLLLDDVGMEYGSDFPLSILRRIIDFRYGRPKEYVTVVSSNLNLDALGEYDGRIADRLLDNKIAKLLKFNYVGSWRRNGNITK